MIFFAQKAFVVEADKLLMVQKSHADPNHPNKWEVPGGRMEEGESLEEQIVREVFEETGFVVIPGKTFFLWEWQIPSRTTVGKSDTVVAAARLCSRAGGAESSEHRVASDFLAETRWTAIASLSSVETIPNMGPVIAEFIRLYRAGQL
jgi:ADP-ribose pyrophosphatase YjhB (NUDIX family)